MTQQDNTTNPLPPLGERGILDHWLRHESAAAGALLVAVVAAMICANSGLREWYEHLWHAKAGFRVGGVEFVQSLHVWVNDGLMAIFFFLVGLEIKRELMVGELASFRRALLPALAALGGMLCPALVYTWFNYGQPSQSGWGIPMATDIAFAVGCMGLLGKRVPKGLIVFLLALAIVDDLGSVMVIAIFYTKGIDTIPLVMGLSLILVSALLARLGVRATWVYVVIGVATWVSFLGSGVHATIAGVLLAFTIPATARYETRFFSERLDVLQNRFNKEEQLRPAHPLMINEHQQDLIRALSRECFYVEAPLQRIEYALHHVVLFLILPVFAFASGGVHLSLAAIGDLLMSPVALGVFFGLLLGKQVGIFLFTFIAVRLGWASLPKGAKWIHVYGVAWLAGIGFTMSNFINELAFPVASSGDPAATYLAAGKVGVLLASLVTGVGGYLLLRYVAPSAEEHADGPAHAA